MNFLEKLDKMLLKYNLNYHSLSKNSGIPYTTIVGWYKKGYESIKVTTLRQVAEYFNTTLDFWIRDDIDDPNYGKTAGYQIMYEEMEHIDKMRALDAHGIELLQAVTEIEYKRCTSKK